MGNIEEIHFREGEFELSVRVEPQADTVWLNRQQMAQLFDRDIKTIGKHIQSALREELDNSTVAKFATVQLEGTREVERQVEYYNLDMIISVGYRVKSARGVQFFLSAQFLLIFGSFYQILSRLQAGFEPIMLESRRRFGIKQGNIKS